MEQEEECQACEYKYLRGGGCKARRFYSKDKKDLYCSAYKENFEHIKNEIEQLL